MRAPAAGSRLLYIAGYGRSGSTILERLLSAHTDVEGVGELEYLTRDPALKRSYCGCGERIPSCSLWGPVLARIERTYTPADIRRDQNLCDGPPFEALLRPASPAVRRWTTFNRELIDAVTGTYATAPKYLIDSSKTSLPNCLRPHTLSKASGPITLIHLVRDGRGCMWSYVSKGSNRKLERGEQPHKPFQGVRTAVTWFLSNVAAELYRLHPHVTYIRLRYEDLTEKPERTLRHLGTLLEFDTSPIIERLRAASHFPPIHQVAGNRMRRADAIRLQPDTRWRAELPARYRVLFFAVNWFLALRYGYHPGRGSHPGNG